MHEKEFSVMVSPSSPLKAVRSSGYTYTITCPQYTGISGAANDSRSFDLNTSNREWVGRQRGIVSIGGMLTPLDSVRMRDATDGLSNTMIVSCHGGLPTACQIESQQKGTPHAMIQSLLQMTQEVCPNLRCRTTYLNPNPRHVVNHNPHPLCENLLTPKAVTRPL